MNVSSDNVILKL